MKYSKAYTRGKLGKKQKKNYKSNLSRNFAAKKAFRAQLNILLYNLFDNNLIFINNELFFDFSIQNIFQ